MSDYDWYGDKRFEALVGETLTSIDGKQGDTQLIFHAGGKAWSMHHVQDCCEYVRLEDVAGDLDDLIGSPILLAEVVSHDNESPPGVAALDPADDSYTWTFYKLATAKGHVTLRWLGESNGYYSEGVNFDALTGDQP